MKINAGEIRVGMLLEYKNDLWQVLKTQHVKPGKGGAFAQVEMKSVGKNTKLNERFRSSETVEKASLEEIDFNYLYDDENNYIFMDPKTFEQIEIKKDIVGDFLTSGFSTVGVRIPNDNIALSILEKFGPMAVTSLNLSSEPAIKKYDEAVRYENVVDYIIEGTDLTNISSTVYDVVNKKVLRQGEIIIYTSLMKYLKNLLNVYIFNNN